MCTGKVLKIESDIPVVRAKQTQARSVYAQDLYTLPKPGVSGLELDYDEMND